MLSDNDMIDAAMRIRSRYQRRVRENRTAGERLADFAKLQQASFRVLCASPRGSRHFLERNLRSRRAEVIDGVWKPISPARRAQQA
jgi:hypothetical protein